MEPCLFMFNAQSNAPGRSQGRDPEYAGDGGVKGNDINLFQNIVQSGATLENLSQIPTYPVKDATLHISTT